MAQELRALFTFVEDPVSIPNTYRVTQNYLYIQSPGNLMPPSDLKAPGTQVGHTYTHEDKTLKHIKQIKHSPVVRVFV